MSAEIDTLSEAQRQVLRLVLLGRKSAAIAAELGISEHTVDQRCRVANRKLGTGDRFAAARLLAAHEGIPPYQQLIYQTPSLAGVSNMGSPTVLPDPQAQGDEPEHILEIRDVQAPYTPDFAKTEAASASRMSGARNELTARERLHQIAVTAVQFSTVVCMVVLLALLITLARQRS